MTPKEVGKRAASAMHMYRIHLALGMRPEEAAGWAANAEAESRGDYRARQPGGPGRGLFQWGAHDPKLDRRLDFRRLFGHPIEQSTAAEQLVFRDWELAHTEARAAKEIAKARGAGNIAAAIAIHYERPENKFQRAIDRANIAEEIIRRSN
ncbi:MAG TPA: phage tail tip lysozyme [Sphingomicrobium sp.]|nr:phage tail tip lysozyme [Sphingomicrobium sp.]